MKIFIRVLFSAYILIVLSSCTKIVYISKRIDPEIILEKGNHNIVFVNLFDYTLPVNAYKKDRILYYTGVRNLLDGLSLFSSNSSFSFVTGDTLKKGIENGFLTTLLPIDTIKSICKRFNSNLLLALDSMNILLERDTVVNYYYGEKYRTINRYLETRFFMSLYSEEGELINRSEVDKSSLFRPRSTASGYIIVVPSISAAREEIENLAYQAGQDYINKFYPHIIHDTQQLYTDITFKESNDYIFSRNWEKATELLEELTKNQNPSIAEKARHNLEIVKEASEADLRK
jgi:hypothetical protein